MLPTIEGREHWLARCLDAYYATSPADTEYVTVLNRATCGIAWNEGAELARGDYLHFSADDLEPHEGWWEAACACVETGALPSPRILNTDASLQSCGEWGQEMEEGARTYITRVPFLSRAQWEQVGPGIETHYYTDNAISFRGDLAGIPTVICRDYLFTHHFAPEGRVDERMQADYEAYQRWCAQQTA